MPVAAYKSLGFLVTVLVIAGFYWIGPLYEDKRYDLVWLILAPLFGLAIILSYPYSWWVDKKKGLILDGYYYVGLLVTGRWDQLDRKCLKKHCLCWGVKGFFLPLMLSGLFLQWEIVSALKFDIKNFNSLYTYIITSVYVLDVGIGSLGYLCTLRIFNAEIKSVDMTFLGWFACLICYAPFNRIFGGSFYGYDSELTWDVWLVEYPIIYITWALLIIGLHVIYVAATCSFGIRFSNLTNRGIIRRGPYRYLKHPAYVSKNIAWWLVQVPFVVHIGFFDSLRACICLVIVNAIYALRAYTEERHLMKDSAYADYSNWMSEHGLFAKFKGAVVAKRS